MSITNFQEEKRVVREYFNAIENATQENLAEVLKSHTSEDYLWQGVFPFREQRGSVAVAEVFWAPLKKSLTRMQRRQDIFIGGENEITKGEICVMSMGHFMGLFDYEFLGMRPTGKIINIRYAEFNWIEKGRITRTGLFLDLIGMMEQADCYPLPPSTGKHYVYPGPRNHDGLLFEDEAREESEGISQQNDR